MFAVVVEDAVVAVYSEVTRAQAEAAKWGGEVAVIPFNVPLENLIYYAAYNRKTRRFVARVYHGTASDAIIVTDEIVIGRSSESMEHAATLASLVPPSFVAPGTYLPSDFGSMS